MLLVPKEVAKKMKHTIIFILLFLFVIACTGRQTDLRCGGGGGALDSVTVDLRCEKIEDEARKKMKSSGFCYFQLEDDPRILTRGERQKLHPNPSACDAIWQEAQKKCEALPGYLKDPRYTDTLSGGAVYQGKKPIMIDGKPVCP